jgi:hypothetical protein
LFRKATQAAEKRFDAVLAVEVRFQGNLSIEKDVSQGLKALISDGSMWHG